MRFCSAPSDTLAARPVPVDQDTQDLNRRSRVPKSQRQMLVQQEAPEREGKFVDEYMYEVAGGDVCRDCVQNGTVVPGLCSRLTYVSENGPAILSSSSVQVSIHEGKVITKLQMSGGLH